MVHAHLPPLASNFVRQYWFIVFRVGMRMRAGLVTAIYRKSFKLSAEVRQKFTVGEITSASSKRFSQRTQTHDYAHAEQL